MSKADDKAFRRARQENQWHTLVVNEEFRLAGVRGALYERLRRQTDLVYLADDGGGHLGVALNGVGVDTWTSFRSGEAREFAQGHCARKYAAKMVPFATPVPDKARTVVWCDTARVEDLSHTLGGCLAALPEDGQLFAILPATGEGAFTDASTRQLAQSLSLQCPGRWPFEALAGGDEILLGVRKTRVARKVGVVFGILGEADMATEVARDGRTKTGYFNWLRMLHGEAIYTRESTAYEDYDLLLLQLSGTNFDGPRQIRQRLGPNAKTKLLVWCDYALEHWERYPPHQDQILFQLDQADYIAAVEPMQQRALAALLGREVHLLPHPTDVPAIAREARPVAERQGCVVITHRDGQDYLPSLMLRGSGLQTLLLGLMTPISNATGSEIQYPAMLYDRIEAQYIGGEIMIGAMARYLIAIDSYTHHVCGRTTQELAALGVPTIGYPCVEAQTRCWPELTIEAGDVAAGRALVERLLTDQAFFEGCVAHAQQAVHYYNYASALERLNAVIGAPDDARPRIHAQLEATGPGSNGQVEPADPPLGNMASVLEPRPA